jgi:peptide deformylase
MPGLRGVVPRHTHVRYGGITPEGKEISREASGFHARVVQHECDHLDGVLFPMRMTDLSLFSFTEELRHGFADEVNARRDTAGRIP